MAQDTMQEQACAILLIAFFQPTLEAHGVL